MTLKQKIAVVGGGVSGIVSAYLLSRKYEVHLFEAAEYLGGHTNTLDVVEPGGATVPVDTGFIVLNDQTYPNFTKFLGELNVPIRYSNMSFGYADERDGFCYAGNGLGGMFADRVNAFRPSFYSFIFEIRRFSQQAWADLERGIDPVETLGSYLKRLGYSDRLVERYVIPIGAAIWSTRFAEMLNFPAATLLRFFKNHGLLALKNRPRWQTVVGGSQQYVRRFREIFEGEIYLSSPVQAVARSGEEVELTFQSGERRSFAYACIATHADTALKLLAKPSPLQERLLSPWSYEKNDTILHFDSSVLPSNRRAWASWNFVRPKQFNAEVPLFVSYYMNLLQGLESQRDYIVTLNSSVDIDEEKIVRRIAYDHPLFTSESVATQSELPSLNEESAKVRFAGSYFNYGFHEDAVSSGVHLARSFGVDF